MLSFQSDSMLHVLTVTPLSFMSSMSYNCVLVLRLLDSLSMYRPCGLRTCAPRPCLVTLYFCSRHPAPPPQTDAPLEQAEDKVSHGRAATIIAHFFFFKFPGYLAPSSNLKFANVPNPDHVAALVGKWSDRCVLSVWAVRGKPLYVLSC